MKNEEGKNLPESTRRNFFKHMGLAAAALTTSLGTPIFPQGLEAQAEDDPEKKLINLKKGLTILSDRPLNLETPPHLLDDEITPADRLFVRNNGFVPESAFKKPSSSSSWTLTIDGEVERPLKLSLEDLKKKFPHHTYQLVLECAGNGRAGFEPPTAGNQWTYGAVGCPQWTGVRLKDVLKEAGLKSTAVYTGYYGDDLHLNGDPEKVVISRGTPIAKALEETTLLAFSMNGKPIPPSHGFPLRLVVPGYPGSASGKWLKRLTIRDRVHDGPHMEGYRMPAHPLLPGGKISDDKMMIIENMPVKSLITFPASGETIKLSQAAKFQCRGFAWTGEEKITAVDISFNFGQTWLPATLKNPANRFSWQRWEATLPLPSEGYFEIWARATDSSGKMQPMVVPGWNPKGYLNNAMPRIAVTVVA